jgi:hypothetical protein
VAAVIVAGLISTKYGRNFRLRNACWQPNHSRWSQHAATNLNANALATLTAAKPIAESASVVEDLAELVSN